MAPDFGFPVEVNERPTAPLLWISTSGRQGPMRQRRRAIAPGAPACGLASAA